MPGVTQCFLSGAGKSRVVRDRLREKGETELGLEE